jgi:hypothetical protein
MKNLIISIILFSCSACHSKENNFANKTPYIKLASNKEIENPFYSNQDKNIEDYYLNIPSNGLFNCEKSIIPNQEFRKKNIVKKDIKNGYILATDSSDFKLEMALFKDKIKNRDVIGVFSRPCNIGEQCSSSYEFWTVLENKWKNITNEVIGIEYITNTIEKEKGILLGFRLPEIGTNISVVDCDNVTETGIFLKWKNGKFIYDNSSKNESASVAFRIEKIKIDKPSCKIKYKIFDPTNKEVIIPVNLKVNQECPALFTLSPNGKYLFYRNDHSLNMLDLTLMKSTSIFSLDQKDGVSDPLWTKNNNKIIFALINEINFKYKGKFLIFDFNEGTIKISKEADAPIDYVCGSYCLSMPDDEFWLEDNETAIGYKVNNLIDNKPKEAGYLKLK